MNAEIEELKKAYSASPDNKYILSMLIQKMRTVPDYYGELEGLLQQALANDPNNIDHKCTLIDVYFAQQKHSTCLIIGEELGLDSDLPIPTLEKLSLCYLRESNLAEAKRIYQHILQRRPSYTHDELDSVFRVPSFVDDIEEQIEAGHFVKPDINFSDVGGMDDVKREIDLKIIKPLEHADLYKSYGKKIGGGILLYGPPGCGKTYIAKATAGQINANFINIGLNDILDMWQGESEKNLHKYFELAREKKPCVIFFDEVDALGAKRSDLRTSTGKTVINQFLSELDGLDSDNDGLLIIGATNTPWHLDSAFLRPGRFDRIIFVPPPDAAGREAITELKLKDKPISKIDYKKIAKKTDKYSGADLNAIIDIAIEGVLEEAIQSGTPKPLSTDDLIKAIKKHRASTVDWFTTAKNYAMFANKSGLYDDILKYTK